MVSAGAVAGEPPCVYEPGQGEAPKQGQECEVHRGALAHAHKRTGLSPHRLPCCGNPGILLYANDMRSVERYSWSNHRS